MALEKELSIIVKYRSAIMGIAILWIFLLHSGACGIPFYDSVVSFGWMGVDIFFFVSALGLSYSLEKNQSKWEFYKRRIKRVIPTWLLVLFIIHMLGIVILIIMPEVPFYYPHDCVQILSWYTGMGYWFNGILDNPLCYYYEWYIPTLLLFYLVAPFLYKRKTSTLYFLLIIVLILSLLFSCFEILYSLHLSYQRIPIFIWGFIVYRMISGEIRNCLVVLFVMSVLGIVTIYLSISFNIIFIKYVPLFLILPVLIILAKIIELTKTNQLFSFLGVISLEIYLLHLYQRPNYLVSLLFRIEGLLCVMITFLLCVYIAFLFHKLCNYINARI